MPATTPRNTPAFRSCDATDRPALRASPKGLRSRISPPSAYRWAYPDRRARRGGPGRRAPRSGRDRAQERLPPHPGGSPAPRPGARARRRRCRGMGVHFRRSSRPAGEPRGWESGGRRPEAVPAQSGRQRRAIIRTHHERVRGLYGSPSTTTAPASPSGSRSSSAALPPPAAALSRRCACSTPAAGREAMRPPFDPTWVRSTRWTSTPRCWKSRGRSSAARRDVRSPSTRRASRRFPSRTRASTR